MEDETRQGMEIREVKDADKPKKPELRMKVAPAFDDVLLNMMWRVIKPVVEELAEKSKGEFDAYSVYRDIKYGAATLCMGYVVDDPEAYDKGQPVKETYAGFLLVRDLPTGYHIWVVYIEPQFRATNIFDLGYKWILEQAMNKSASHITISAISSEWRDRLSQLGYDETFTLFRKKIK